MNKNKILSGEQVKFSIVILTCIILFVTAFMLSSDSKLYAGHGNGKNAPIKTLAEVSDFVDCITNQTKQHNTNTKKTAKNNNKNENANKYTSATFDIDSYLNLSITMPVDRYSVNGHMNMQRKMTVYISENSTLYKTSGVLTVSVNEAKNNINETVTFNFDFEMYFSNDLSAIKINNFSITGLESETISFPVKALKKWIDINSESGENLLDRLSVVNKENFRQLSLLGELISEHKNNEESIIENGKYFSITENAFKTFAQKLYDTNLDPSSIDGSLEIDLSIAEIPKIIYNYHDTENTEEKFFMKFKYINNTVIDTLSKNDLINLNEISN